MKNPCNGPHNSFCANVPVLLAGTSLDFDSQILIHNAYASEEHIQQARAAFQRGDARTAVRWLLKSGHGVLVLPYEEYIYKGQRRWTMNTVHDESTLLSLVTRTKKPLIWHLAPWRKDPDFWPIQPDNEQG